MLFSQYNGTVMYFDIWMIIAVLEINVVYSIYNSILHDQF